MAGTITSSPINHRPRGLVKIKAAWTTDASGDASISAIGTAYGKLVAVGYDPGGSATGIDLTVTEKDSGKAILTLTDAGLTARWFRPTTVVTTDAGVGITAAATAPNVNRDLYVSGKLQLTVAQGGSGKTGALYLVVDENRA